MLSETSGESSTSEDEKVEATQALADSPPSPRASVAHTRGTSFHDVMRPRLHSMPELGSPSPFQRDTLGKRTVDWFTRAYRGTAFGCLSRVGVRVRQRLLWVRHRVLLLHVAALPLGIACHFCNVFCKL